MNVGTVMDELGDVLSTLPGLRVYPWNADAVAVPAAVIELPEEITYDATKVRGADRMALRIHVLVGRVLDRTARDDLSRYCDGGGVASVKRVIDGHAPTAYDSARVESVRFDSFLVGQVDYLGATFMVDVIGSGS